ncbi:S24 family peptidase [Shewanella baltica]|uniref:S24 family peptidase n=1 Tax=Shewanella baltica TaxID=62322 RepID=UPI0030D4B068
MTKLDISMDTGKNPFETSNNPKGIIPSEQIIPFKARISEIIGENSVRAFARSCSLSDKTLRDYMSGKTYPTLDRLALIAEASGRSINWLATGDVEASKAMMSQEIAGNIKVPEYNVRASAGAGSFVNQEVKTGEFSFPEAWLKEKKLFDYNLCVISAWGDSMEPAISHQDSLLIKLLDKSEKAAYDGVFILRLDEMLLVKRMKYDMNMQGHHIISDNSQHGSTFVPNQEFDERIKIIGSVAGVVYRQIASLKIAVGITELNEA